MAMNCRPPGPVCSKLAVVSEVLLRRRSKYQYREQVDRDRTAMEHVHETTQLVEDARVLGAAT
jgi:hypothetical protein